MARRYNEQTFRTEVVGINYMEGAPNGPPLLLLHGLAARWQVFAPLLPALSADWHVYALDFRGHGKSGRVPGRYQIKDFAEDTAAFLLRQLAEPAVLYGHSLGGWVALRVAAELPRLVPAVVVGDSAIFPGHLDPELSVSYLADLPLAMRSLSQSLQQLDPDVMRTFREGRMVGDFDAEALLRRISCPVLLLQGNPALGALMSDADVERTLALVPQARHKRFEDLGHGLHVQDAGQVLEAVAAFLAPLRAAGQPTS